MTMKVEIEASGPAKPTFGDIVVGQAFFWAAITDRTLWEVRIKWSDTEVLRPDENKIGPVSSGADTSEVILLDAVLKVKVAE